MNRLIDLIKTGDGHQRWTMALLKALADRDCAWSDALTEFSISEKNRALKRVVRALATNGGGNSAAKIFARALDGVESLTPVERLFCSLAGDLTIELDEERVLRSLKRDARNTLRLFGDLFFTASHDQRPIKIHDASEWISVLVKAFRHEEWMKNTSLLSVCDYLANAMQVSEHKSVLDCANDSKNPASDFVLGLIVPRVPGVTTDDLTSAAASRLLDLYVKGQIDFFPSPGEIATERFLTETVLPYAQSMSDDRQEREAIERTLLDAGRRHDRRYSPPWLVE
jgi:hypothetical protein